MQLFPGNHKSNISLLPQSPFTLVVPDEASHDGGGHEEAVSGGDSGAIKRGHRSLFRLGRRFWKGKKERNEGPLNGECDRRLKEARKRLP